MEMIGNIKEEVTHIVGGKQEQIQSNIALIEEEKIEFKVVEHNESWPYTYVPYVNPWITRRD